jgi:transposase-like protein
MNAKKLECPSCGLITMYLKTGISNLEDGVKVSKISRWVCENCGEELFDMKAMKEIRIQRKEKTIPA